MKKIFLIILTMIAIALPSTAHGANNKSTPRPVIIVINPTSDKPNQRPHRAPMHVCVDAYYDELSSTITINYDGEAAGEALLYKDGELIDSSSEINTTFSIMESGYYTIEINTEYWTATGSIEI